MSAHHAPTIPGGPAASSGAAALLTTAITPAVWGTTYLVTTEMLPEGRPLLAATLRLSRPACS
jgi:hypothetical protein